ncbi:Alpha-ketoglutarate-dependent sulfonate dioxygenase [Vanrija pseudolonga]|uniref:Alpha-ketoglutarate-dependent sulfonate dioxygenase n=1 Tax=Vanrija pseudolonga TaxID=143232 RepID=A0AAF0YAK4_9TREE|nr:Alpha-ketoglutarate-dependent sulfonate dioxygenase [Vanrija pseudolonga]
MTNTSESNDPLYPDYLPVWEYNTLPDWEEVAFTDAGTRATDDYNYLFPADHTAHRRPVSPYIGEEIRGIQLSQLDKPALDDLALLVARRGVVIFRDQDWKARAVVDTVRHFGRLRIHPTMGYPEGFPEIHVLYQDPKDAATSKNTVVSLDYSDKISSINWHIDHSSEVQPAGLTFFWNLEHPDVGGDTQFVSLTEAYNRLSPELQRGLDGLQVLHDNSSMLHYSRENGGPARFNSVRRHHPLIRTHPATGDRALFVHGFVQAIHGLKAEESTWILSFLQDIVAKGSEYQIRARWEPGSVVVWDNRVVAHTATPDLAGVEGRRHMVRIAAMAEVPV